MKKVQNVKTKSAFMPNIYYYWFFSFSILKNY